MDDNTRRWLDGKDRSLVSLPLNEWSGIEYYTNLAAKNMRNGQGIAEQRGRELLSSLSRIPSLPHRPVASGSGFTGSFSRTSTVCGLEVKADGTIGTDDEIVLIRHDYIDEGRVGIYKNKNFNREEIWWYSNEAGACYIRLNSCDYVRVDETSKGWKIDPKDHYVKEDGRWTRKKR
ncbi:hypothetical protein KY326_04480 [Candidatus Woesearchaeota archaeon]|nr:hypothetical protein [Candidatus Woesearchaeota archaeon]